MIEKVVKQTKVPKTPKIIIFPMLEKKLPLCILNPLAKTIGGKQT